MGLSQDTLYVIESYKTHFLGKKNIVLYGVGINTKAILTEIQDPNIIGLMDPLSEGSVVMGKPVLSVEDASRQAGLIVIIARPTVVPIIFDRIRGLESTHHIPIYNIEGKRLIEEKQESFSSDLPYWNSSSDSLKQKIAMADVVSFDVFDTLIVRDVLRPVDLFFFLERKMQKEGISCKEFAVQRQAAEAQLNQVCVPNLNQIYEQLGVHYAWSKEIVDKASSLEFALEQKACHARKHMQDIYHYALRLKKTVILVSDMYLNMEKMQILLERAGYTGYHRLYVSCEYQATKASGGLFDAVRKDYSGTILHIGDNAAVDDVMARMHGFVTYPIFSAYDMLLHSSMGKLVAKAKTPDSMLTLGIAARQLFDDPFVLGPTKGMARVDDLFQFGYVFIGPVISCFVRWMCEKVWDKNYDMILFSARDGYLIEKLYRKRWIQNKEHLPKGVYFKTSRRAVTVAALTNEDDILAMLSDSFDTTKGELLLVRFGIFPDKTDVEALEKVSSTYNPDDAIQFILRYQDRILENAKRERSNYIAYLKKIGLLHAKKVVLYDFCSKGTVQFGLSKLLGSDVDILGMYFATLDLKNDVDHGHNCIISLFGDCTRYHPRFSTVKEFMFMEAILSDRYETLLCCDANGEFIYQDEVSGYRDCNVLAQIQQGILYFDRSFQAWSELINTEEDETYRHFCDDIFGVLFNGSCVIGSQVKKAVVIDGRNDFKPPYQLLL